MTADLSPNGSIHRRTFIESIKLAWANLNLGGKNIQLIWENDFATEIGGIEASNKLINKGVDFVVGHYSSTAAKHALPYYAKEQIPVFLPAASSDILTQEFDYTFRICGKDSDLACLISSHIASKKPHKLYIGCDNTVHGIELSYLIKKNLSSVSAATLTNKLNNANKVIFIGNFNNTVDFMNINKRHLQNTEELYFTDDLVHPELANYAIPKKTNIFIFGYAHSINYADAKFINNQYYCTHHEYPSTFFLETYASFEIIDQLIALSKNSNEWKILLGQKDWKTVVGRITFKDSRDSIHPKFALWKFENNNLKMIKEYKNDRQESTFVL
ncbi:ABC transporter substrate-binding protein [Yeosuana marina]|uniref:ABC transporter substrate-binding protein n=1 Tax=Yeosuana marina TaxID=1565536 RepID=UPI0030C88C58